ncbi:MAG: VWA domain-containing protein [Planctomycetota bacterium]|nr:VWA domain-containing protein [Planctomycetota bacterium]
MTVRRWIAFILCVTAVAIPTVAQAPEKKPPARAAPIVVAPLSESVTLQLVKAYGESEHWAMRALVLLSLGTDFHPVAAAILVTSLKDKDARLPPFSVELIRRMTATAAPKIATVPLMIELLAQLKSKNPLLRERVLSALKALAPDALCKDPAEWAKWWSEHSGTFVPQEWTAPENGMKAATGTVASKVVERAFDLRDAGLEVVFVLDTTGSMQIAINAARDAIDEVVLLLAGITQKLKLGLVHYKDFDDMSDGAHLLVPLTKNHKLLQEKLAKLIASGGGDVPERVEKGIEVALGKETGWNKDANRLILLIGDAPPHDEDEKALIEMVKRAHDEPFAKGKKSATTGSAAKVDLRPFITSALATDKAAKPAFDAIAVAGGGASVLLDLAKMKKVDGKLIGNQRSAGQQVAEHVLLLSFGPSYADELRVFVDVFFEYHNAGVF